MPSLNKTWFISDLHLDPGHPEITSQFIKLMHSADNTVNDIYILGDLFEVWIGDDDHGAFNDGIAELLAKTAGRGTRIHFMHGNRDFLIGKKFLAASGCDLLKDEEKINLYGTPVLLMHGDTLCTQDIHYLRARKFAHNKILQNIFLMLPVKLRKKIASGARHASTKHTSTTDAAIMDVTQIEVERMMRKHDVNTLIHGHTHRPNIHTFQADHQEKSRIVLPAWHNGGSVFEWRSDGTKEFIQI